MKKILHVVNIPFVIPYYLGDQISYFQNHDYEVYIATHNSEKLDDYVTKWKFSAVKLNIKRAFSPLNDFITICRLILFIKKNNISIVVGHTPKGALLSMISSYILNIPRRIYFRHGLMYETSSGIKRNILVAIEKFTSFLATEVVCVSNSVLLNSKIYNLSRPDKLKIINHGTCNGIDSDFKFNKNSINKNELKLLKNKLKLNSSDFVVGYVGRISKDKGISELIDAWMLLIKGIYNLKLVICGPYDSRDPLDDSKLTIMRNEPSIIHVGEVDNVEYYYSLFNLFILPSYREGFPTVVLEASSMELPIITTQATGCRDSIIENVTGVFTEIDCNAIQHQILYYINNPLIAKLHGKHGREFVIERFSQKIIWDNLLNNLYN